MLLLAQLLQLNYFKPNRSTWSINTPVLSMTAFSPSGDCPRPTFNFLTLQSEMLELAVAGKNHIQIFGHTVWYVNIHVWYSRVSE